MMKNYLLLLVIPCFLFSVELTPAEKSLLKRSAAQYRELVFPPSIPRAFDVSRAGCPVCGDAIKKHGSYSWIISPDKLFKLKCPECGSEFPSNDFEAYYRSGFRDKSLLTGDYPDDGRGWVKVPGQPKYWFVAYYNHWFFHRISFHKKLAAAYARTGDPEFARRTAAMLDKYAEYYPDYDYNTQSRYAEEVQPDYTGRIVNAIWETGHAGAMADIYMQLRPFLDRPDDELQRITGKTNEQIKANIENNMLRVMANDIMTVNRRILGNFGMHQVTLLKISKALNEPDMARWVTDFRKGSTPSTTPLFYAIYDNLFGDGAPYESPGYNCGWINNISLILSALRENGVDVLASHPTLKRLFYYCENFTACGKFSPSSGDTGNISALAYYAAYAENQRLIYNADPSRVNATILALRNPNNKKLQKELEGKTDPEFGFRCGLLPAYGMALIQNGNHESPTAAILAFPNYIGLRHADSLDIQIYAENVAMTPDLGYPESASSDDPARGAYFSNTLVHNTVVVDARKQNRAQALLKRFDYMDSFAKRVVVDNPGCYPDLSKYQRSLLSCETAPGKTVYLDVFRIDGGSQHDWFMHSNGETFSSDVPFSAPAPGTLAGRNVKPGEFYDCPEMAASNFIHYSGSGFQFLLNPASGTSFPGCHITFPSHANGGRFIPREGAALKLFLLDRDSELFISDGRPPVTQRNTQKKLKFLTRRRKGAAPLSSVFTTVIETTSKEKAALDIASVEPIGDGTLAAVKVTFLDGRLLYMFDAEPSASFSHDGIAFCGEAGALLIDPASNLLKAYVTGPGSIRMGNRTLVSAEKPFASKVKAIGLKSETITFEDAIPESFVGAMFSAGRFSYRIKGIDGAKATLLEQTPIRGRFRAEAEKKQKCVYSASPTPMLAKEGMALYSGLNEDDFVTTIRSIKRNHITTESPLMPDVDYWISECKPGDPVFIPTSATAVLKNLP